MSVPVQVLVRRYAAARAVERAAEDLRKQLQRYLSTVLQRYMDAQYDCEHGRSPDPLTWRTDQIEVDPERELLVVTGQYLYGDEWEPRTRSVEIPIQELIEQEVEKSTAEQGNDPGAKAHGLDRDAEVLALLRNELQAMQERLVTPELGARIGSELDESAIAPELRSDASCWKRLDEIRRLLYSLGSLSADRLWVTIPVWTLRPISHFLSAPDVSDLSGH